MHDRRLLSISSSLPEAALIPTRLSVVETLSEPYLIELEVLGASPTLKPQDLLTQPITVSVRQPLKDAPVVRHFHGLVVEWQRLGPAAGGLSAYRLTAVPGLWRLGLRQNCRIFQNQTFKEIVTTVLSEHDQPAPRWGTLPVSPVAIPYCTQFNETDLAFVTRLLQAYGLSYYFEHTDKAHTLHINGVNAGFPAFAGGPMTVVHGSEVATELGSWRQSNHARSHTVTLQDMDAERSQPSVKLTGNSPTRKYPGEPAMWTGGKVSHWPGGMSTRPGADPAKLEMLAAELASEHAESQALDPRLSAGVRLVVGFRDESGAVTKVNHLVTAVHHEAEDHSGLTAGGGGTEHYACSLQLCAAEREWVPRALYPRPVMAGLHSAQVTGAAGKMLHTDDFGRVKVKFRWDTAGPSDDHSSCWVRVAQAAAGSWGGTWFLPRVGDEVLVSFLDGDPDRPLVIGSVYGKDAKPPFAPGTNPAQSGISTRTDKSGSTADANVLRFDDKPGAEQVLLHAQRDLQVEVEHDRTETIDNARTTTIKAADDQLTLNSGNLSIKVESGHVTIEAMQKITLKVGSNSVVIDQQGITTKGLTVKSEGSVMHETKAPMVKVDGSGMVMVKGGVVMLN